MKRTIAAILLMAMAQPVQAAGADALFNAGQFAAAADAARMVPTADSLTLAARATLVVAAYEVDDKAKALKLIAEAEADADRALKQAPDKVDALLQKAIAIGYRAKLTRSPGAAKDARTLMEDATRRAPKSALAWASLGGWHGESVVTLGRFLAGTMVGAKAKAGIAAYDRALALDPDSPVFRTLYAITLADLDPDAQRLRTLLTPAARGTGGDGFDQLMRARARALLAALDGGKAGAITAAAAKARPFARIR
jgi:tetratricopeptide (TPR) repeat protein